MNKNDFLVMRYMVMDFDPEIDSLRQFSVSLGLEDARKFLLQSRERHPNREFYIVAVLDE